MKILKLIAVIFWLGAAPFGTGLSLTGKKRTDADGFWMNLLCGYFAMFAVFQFLCIPAIFLKIRFSVLCIGYEIICGLWFLISVFVNRKRLGACSIAHLKKWKQMPFILLLAILVIGMQMGIYVVGANLNADDAMYVATATTSIETDSLFQFSSYTGEILREFPKRYVLSPFPIFLAFVSNVAGMNPAAVAHTILPVFLLALAYAVYGLWGQRLFHGDLKATGLFLFFAAVLQMFSYYTTHGQGTVMLIRIWQGKAFLAAALLPAVLYFGWSYFLQEETGIREWLNLLFLMTSCSMVSSMGIILAPVMLGCMGIAALLFRRKWRALPGGVLACSPCLVLAAVYLIL